MSSPRAQLAQVVRSTLAYAAGISESNLADSSGLAELGIDSVGMLAAGAVLQAEMEIVFSEEQILRIFTAESVSEAIAIACDLYDDLSAAR